MPGKFPQLIHPPVLENTFAQADPPPECRQWTNPVALPAKWFSKASCSALFFSAVASRSMATKWVHCARRVKNGNEVHVHPKLGAILPIIEDLPPDRLPLRQGVLNLRPKCVVRIFALKKPWTAAQRLGGITRDPLERFIHKDNPWPRLLNRIGLGDHDDLVEIGDASVEQGQMLLAFFPRRNVAHHFRHADRFACGVLYGRSRD